MTSKYAFALQWVVSSSASTWTAAGIVEPSNLLLVLFVLLVAEWSK
jgi:hypothetical protein